MVSEYPKPSFNVSTYAEKWKMHNYPILNHRGTEIKFTDTHKYLGIHFD